MTPLQLPTIEQLKPQLDQLEASPGGVVLIIIETGGKQKALQIRAGFFTPSERQNLEPFLKNCRRLRPTGPAKLGRPSLRSPDLAQAICSRLAEGESLRAICGSPEMPSLEFVRRWLRDDRDFAAQYARAREEQAENFAEEIIQIADDGSNDCYVDQDGNKVVDHDVIHRSRLRVEARKWIAAKLLPKKYGDKGADVNISNTTVNNTLILSEARREELMVRWRKLQLENPSADSDPIRHLQAPETSLPELSPQDRQRIAREREAEEQRQLRALEEFSAGAEQTYNSNDDDTDEFSI